MAVSKVELTNGEVLMDLTSDTVTPETLAEGATAHDAAGNLVRGVMATTSVLYTAQALTEEQQAQARENIGAVPTSRTINGKALSGNISLSASDVGARPSTWTPTAANVGAVPTSRTVNGKALSANITLSASDVGATTKDGAFTHGTYNGDFNEAPLGTWWTQPANAATNGCANYPEGATYGFVTTANSGSLYQTYTQYANGKTWFRSRVTNSGVAKWYGWFRLDGLDSAPKSHVNDKSNPHGVTADQISAAPVDHKHMEKIWENANKGGDFPAQTVPLNLSGYSHIIVTSSVGNYPDTGLTSSGLIDNVVNAVGYLSTFATDFWMHTRHFIIRSNGIEFGNGYMKDTSSGTVYADWAIRSVPSAIYGVRSV